MTTQKTEREEALEAEVKYLKQTLAIEQRKHAKCRREKHALISSSKAEQEMREALMDSQYLAGVTAGWNAAQSDDPNATKAALYQSRAGYLATLSPKKDGK